MSDETRHFDISDDHELQVLAHLHDHERAKQRDIAGAIGLSLGMTNAILKRLAGKGLITMRRLNSRNIHYLVTPTGVDAIAKRSYRYLRRTVGHIVRYKQRVRSILREAAGTGAKGSGVGTVLLVGESDLDFLVEWCAEKEGLTFDRVDGIGGVGPSTGTADARRLVVASEQYALGDADWSDVHLGRLVLEGTGEPTS